MNKNDTSRISALVVFAFMVWHGADATAEIVDFGDNKVPTRTMEFVEDRELGGRTARFDGVVSEQGQRLVIGGLDVMSPFVVKVLAKDIGKPIDVSLHRYFWGKPDAEGSTGTSGDWEFRGRVHDEVGIALSAPEATPVYALVWQGPAVPAAEVPLVVLDTNREAAESGGIDLMTAAILGVLLVIAVLLAMQLIQRRSTAAAVIVATSLLAFGVVQDDAHAKPNDYALPNPFADDTDKPPAPEPPSNPFVDEAGKPPAQEPPANPFVDEADKPAAQEPPPNPFADEQGSTGPKPDSGSTTGPKPEPDTGSSKPPASGSQATPDGDGNAKLKPDPSSNKPDTGDSKLKPDPDSNKPRDGDSKLKPDPDSNKPRDGDSKLKPDPNSNKPRDGDSKLKPDPDSNKPRDGDSKLKPDPDSDKRLPDSDEARKAESDVESGSMDTDDSASTDSGTSADRPFSERLDDVHADIRALRSEVASNAARIRNLEFLINQDRDAVPAPGDGAPPVSVTCDNSPECQACLERANSELSDLLINLDKLRIIYSNYMRYRNYMVGLGDSISGFHQLEQAAWYQVKLQIEEATIGLQGAYDAKFDEFKGRLSDALSALSSCDSVEGDPVFSRESVLFENYVKAKYARDD